MNIEAYKDMRACISRKTTARKLNKCGKTAVMHKKFKLFSYENYCFADKENEFIYSFLFKKSSGSDKMPLVIYLSTSASVGRDNILPFIESYEIRRQLKKRNCNILIPQAPPETDSAKNDDERAKINDSFACSVKQLVDIIVQNENVDEKRIYLIGTSLGGYFTWHSVYNFSGFYACAVAVVGRLFYKESFDKMVSTPIWAAHSADDEVVSVNSDDYTVNELKKLGADVRYSRWNEYGHRMSWRFYKNENWCDWVFSQSR